MAERKRIALIFRIYKEWMGGTYYIINLINSFNYLPDNEKPEIEIICDTDFEFNYVKKNTSYPYILKCENQSNRVSRYFRRIVNSISRFIVGREIIYNRILETQSEIIYPVIISKDIKANTKIIGWVPDFQDKHLPEMFTKQTLKIRDLRVKGLIKKNIPIIFSSDSAKTDFVTYFSNNHVNTNIFKFTSENIKYKELSCTLKKKYQINGNDYFLCCNQFWKHKNHMALFEALKILRSNSDKCIRIICTGELADERDINYVRTLKNFINDNELSSNLTITGFINRNEQIQLMSNSIAIIQPSLFEGWSTSVEEAKSLNKPIIISDIPIHREQISENAFFFNPYNYKELSSLLLKLYNERPLIVNSNYQEKIKESARTFLKIAYSI